LVLILPSEEAAERPRGPFDGGNHIPVVAVRCDLVTDVETVVVNDDPVVERSNATDVFHGDVLVVIE
jgi:hypothetical protein